MNGEVTVNANTATDKQLDEGQIAAENPRIEEGGLGVALSGGGVRATLFSLGALMYLVDSGYSQYVTDISSVSGGSITNAFVAQHIDFKTAHEHPGQFDEVAKNWVES